MKNIILSPSLLSCDFLHIYDQLKILHDKNIKYLHLDVMDGHFVNNISFGIPVIKAISKIKKELGFVLDVHLMITDPYRYLDAFIDSGVDMLSVHIEASSNPVNDIKYIKSKGVKAGIVLNPPTEVDSISEVIKWTDFILIMSVNPGFGGQKFIEETYAKIGYIADMTKNIKNSEHMICVDGGVNVENACEIIRCGANYLVAGSSVFSGNLQNNIDNFYDIINKCEGENK